MAVRRWLRGCLDGAGFRGSLEPHPGVLGWESRRSLRRLKQAPGVPAWRSGLRGRGHSEA